MPGHPKLITHVDPCARPNLVLPLGRHNLGVDSRHVDASKEASTVVCLDQLSANRTACSSRAVVRPLRTWVAVLWPAKRPLGGSVKESVLLLNSEPRLLQKRMQVNRNAPRR